MTGNENTFTYECTTPGCTAKETYSYSLGPNLQKNHKCKTCKPPRIIDEAPSVKIPLNFTADKGFGE